MKKIYFLTVLLSAKVAYAQEVAQVEVAPFYTDKTFLFLVGGAVFLILVLVIKKVLEKRAMKAYQEDSSSDNL